MRVRFSTMAQWYQNHAGRNVGGGGFEIMPADLALARKQIAASLGISDAEQPYFSGSAGNVR